MIPRGNRDHDFGISSVAGSSKNKYSLEFILGELAIREWMHSASKRERHASCVTIDLDSDAGEELTAFLRVNAALL